MSAELCSGLKHAENHYLQRPLRAKSIMLLALIIGSYGTVAATTVEASSQHSDSSVPQSYIVELEEPPLAAIDGTDTTSQTAPPESSQVAALEKAQDHLASEVGATTEQNYTTAFNGFSAQLTADQVHELKSRDDIRSVTKDRIYRQHAVTTTEGLGLSGPHGLWAAIGGTDVAGAGVVIGVLDSGISPENPSFAGNPLQFGTNDSAIPHLTSSSTGATNITMTKANGQVFTGACEEGQAFPASSCSTKLITARYFDNGPKTGAIVVPSGTEYFSPRDQSGHGSHTASIAAGDTKVAANHGGVGPIEISGVAPAAKIAVYKTCWRDAIFGGSGCAESDLVAGIDAAVRDGVDVINFSIGSASGDDDVAGPVDLALLRAASAGIFISASAGNSGPGTSTVDHTEPWVTTVGATTTDQRATIHVADQYLPGISATVFDESPTKAPLVKDLSNPASRFCRPGSLSDKVRGAVVLCQRTTSGDSVAARLGQSAEVSRAGGVAMVLTNTVTSSTDLLAEAHTVPTVHVSLESGNDLGEHALDLTQVLDPGPSGPPDLTDAPVAELIGRAVPSDSASELPVDPQVANFSSRGPALTSHSNILKPDIAAPGVQVLGAYTNATGAPAAFRLMSGTSMAAPQVAGLAALYRSVHLNADPTDIKSALMTTASPTPSAKLKPQGDLFAQGAGEVSPAVFLEPGFVYRTVPEDWNGYLNGLGVDTGTRATPIHASELNQPSLSIGALDKPRTVTRTVTSTAAGSYDAAIALPGFTVDVSPATLSFTAAGQVKTFTLTIERLDASWDEFTLGSLTWEARSHTSDSPLRPATASTLPIAVRPVQVSNEPPLAQLPDPVDPGPEDPTDVPPGGDPASPPNKGGSGGSQIAPGRPPMHIGPNSWLANWPPADLRSRFADIIQSSFPRYWRNKPDRSLVRDLPGLTTVKSSETANSDSQFATSPERSMPSAPRMNLMSRITEIWWSIVVGGALATAGVVFITRRRRHPATKNQ